MNRSFFSHKLGKYVFCELEPITKEEWDSIPDEPGKLSAVEYPDGYYKVVDYFTEDDCIYMTYEEWERAGKPDVIVIDDEDLRAMDEKGLWRVRVQGERGGQNAEVG
ncbi:MAG: hypothetical protein C0P72_011540 [Clostridia bacterium]